MSTSATVKLFALLSILVLAVFVFVNFKVDYWRYVEDPKAQCEAYSTTKVSGRVPPSTDVYDNLKLNRVIREPQNTASNIAYVIAGLYVLYTTSEIMAWSFAVACIFLGFGSGMYHASLIPEWRLIDIIGVYAVLFTLIASGVVNTLKVSWRKNASPILISGLVWGFAFIAGIGRNSIKIYDVKIFDSTYVVVASVTACFLLALICGYNVGFNRSYLKRFIVLWSIAVIAFIGALGDRYNKFLASPNSLIQGHTVWHVCGAASLCLGFILFRQSRREMPN